jgi:hypothetical protein
MAFEAEASRWLGCVVCGDDSEFLSVADHGVEAEVMCSRCGQARLVPVLGQLGGLEVERSA